jgi:hypothetical protein
MRRDCRNVHPIGEVGFAIQVSDLQSQSALLTGQRDPHRHGNGAGDWEPPWDRKGRLAKPSAFQRFV